MSPRCSTSSALILVRNFKKDKKKKKRIENGEERYFGTSYTGSFDAFMHLGGVRGMASKRAKVGSGMDVLGVPSKRRQSGTIAT